MTDIKPYFAKAEEEMNASVLFLDESLSHIRAGKANPKILDVVKVEYYGMPVPLSNVATITVPDAKTISIQPWEKNMFGPIERAIINSELGLTPSNNGEVIRLSLPSPTEERRKQLAKDAKAEGEDAKISVRNARRNAIEKIKKLVKDGLPEDVQKDGEVELQKIHDKYIKKIDELLVAKEKEIMTV